jgi:endonuclease-3
MGGKQAVRRRLKMVDRLLEQQYGTRERRRKRVDPLDELIRTILSQNTNDRNRDRAYAAMREAFPSWHEVMSAPRARLERVLRPGGLAKTKSARIQKILRSIAKRGELSLAYLRRLPTEEVQRGLESFDGVGPKTARCVLLFSLGREAFPIDTHILRVLKRFGIIPSGMTAAKAHEYVPEFVPEGRSYSLHLNIIAHGRAVCHARNPACDTCIIRKQCNYYAEVFTSS